MAPPRKPPKNFLARMFDAFLEETPLAWHYSDLRDAAINDILVWLSVAPEMKEDQAIQASAATFYKILKKEMLTDFSANFQKSKRPKAELELFWSEELMKIGKLCNEQLLALSMYGESKDEGTAKRTAFLTQLKEKIESTSLARIDRLEDGTVYLKKETYVPPTKIFR